MSTGNVGDVVFQRNEGDSGSDVWDDTALILAYDEAVSCMKDKLGGSGPGSRDVNRKRSTGKKKKRNKRDGSVDEQAARVHSTQWKAGDRCRARFTQDGRLYNASIQSVDSEAGTCMVHYDVYENKESQVLSDLLPPKLQSGHHHGNQPPSCASTNESMDCSPHSRSPAAETHRHGTHQHRAHHHGEYHHGNSSAFTTPRTAHDSQPAAWNLPMMPPPPPFYPGMAMPPMMPPPFYGMPPSQATWQPSMPNVLPPPPEIDEDELGHDKEALHSMLIAWYMSGYHTGYYQGLKKGKRHGNRREQKEPDTTNVDHSPKCMHR